MLFDLDTLLHRADYRRNRRILGERIYCKEACRALRVNNADVL